MKKKTYLVILALCAAMAMTACGTSAGQKEETKSTAESQDTADEKDSKAADSAESDSDKESTGTVSGDTRLVSVDDVSKYVTIGQYKGLSLDKTVEAVTDDMVDGRIKEELQNKAEEVTEGSVQNGDVVTINYVGTKDGVAFDGGTANNYELTIGSGTFIDGFEDGIIGMKKGQTKDLDLTFPEEYSSEELAGQEVVFKVTLQSFKRAPELTDDWAAKNTDCKTAEEYRKEIRTTLEDEAKTSAQNTLRETAWNTVLSASEVKEYPQDDLDTAALELQKVYVDTLSDSAKGIYSTISGKTGVSGIESGASDGTASADSSTDGTSEAGADAAASDGEDTQSSDGDTGEDSSYSDGGYEDSSYDDGYTE